MGMGLISHEVTFLSLSLFHVYMRRVGGGVCVCVCVCVCMLERDRDR